MRTIVAAGAAEAEQTLPETAATWILRTEAVARLVAAILAAMIVLTAFARPQRHSFFRLVRPCRTPVPATPR